MYKNLHDFVKVLEKNDELLRVKQFVDPVYEIAEITDRMSKLKNGGKAILFENTGTEFPVLTNAFGSEKRMCLALGISNLDDIGKEINKIFFAITSPKKTFLDKLALLPNILKAAKWMPKNKSGHGKCQEIIFSKVELSKLPILKCYPFDGGKFVTLPMVHTVNPETGARNVGMYRMQVFSDNSTGMHWHKHKTGAAHYEIYKKNKSRMPVAVTLGGDPVYAYCATAPLPDGVDEYLFAGFLRKKNVELVACITQPLQVPSDVDFVIEGYIDTSDPLVVEGPFGDHTGFYSLEDFYPQFHVTCITRRKNAIYPATLVGIPPQEDAYIAKATERIFLEPIKLTISPEITDINLPTEGVAHNIAIVKINKTYAGQAAKVANAMWGAGQMMFNKILIIVSGNVCVHDYKNMIEKISTNIDVSNDVFFMKGPADVLDHAAQKLGFGGKICIDATEKYPEEIVNINNNSNTNTNKLVSFVHKKSFDQDKIDSKITILFDDFVDIGNVSQCVWLAGNNIDAIRDCVIKNGKLIVDASSKTSENFERFWPNIACSSDETIKIVDEKMKNAGFTDLVQSPSATIKNLVLSQGAKVCN